ncbi:MAG: ABC transporter permease [Acetatifactor sp.]|nr:ABC transporter permease [Acetatifactor sp.]
MKKSKKTDRIWSFLSLAIFIAIWEIFCALNSISDTPIINTAFFPSPHKLVTAIVNQIKNGQFQKDLFISMGRVIKGFLIAAVLGVGSGVLCGFFKPLSRLFNPIIELFRPIPAMAFLPIFLLWFGIGESSKVAFIAFGAFFTIYVNTYRSIIYTSPLLIRAAQCLGANKIQVLMKVGIPNSLPGILTGLRLGLGTSLFVLVAAELIAASAGLGFRIMECRNNIAIAIMLAYAFIIGIIGLFFNFIFGLLEKRLLRWSDRVEA